VLVAHHPPKHSAHLVTGLARLHVRNLARRNSLGAGSTREKKAGGGRRGVGGDASAEGYKQLGSITAGKGMYTAFCVQCTVNLRGLCTFRKLETMSVVSWRRRRRFEQLLRRLCLRRIISA
jgi:hypothetical protein